MPAIGLYVNEGGPWRHLWEVGHRVVPTVGPYAGSPGRIVRVDGQKRIVVEFDNEPRASRGVGFYDGVWLRSE